MSDDFQRGLQARLAHLIGEASQWSRGSGAHPPGLVKALNEAFEYGCAEIERLRKRVEELEEADRQWDKTGLVEIIKERDQFKKRIAELERQVAEWQARAVSMFRFIPGDTLWGDIQAVRNAYLAWKTGDTGHE